MVSLRAPEGVNSFVFSSFFSSFFLQEISELEKLECLGGLIELSVINNAVRGL